MFDLSPYYYATGGGFQMIQMCVAIFTKLGVRFPNSIDSCLSTCFTEKNGNLVGTSWIGFAFFLNGAWREFSENFWASRSVENFSAFFPMVEVERWLVLQDQVCICACWTWLAATSRGDQRNWWYCGTVKRGILYWTCDNPSGHPNI